jgi:cytochrome P450
MLQMLMILSVLLRKYEVQLVPGQTIEPRPMVILRPEHGIRMTFTQATSRDVSRLSDCSA